MVTRQPTQPATASEIEEALLEQTKALIGIRSTADQPQELQRALDFVHNILAQHSDITVETFTSNNKPSLLAYYGPKRPERFTVLLNGHVDVVPAESNQFAPRLQRGKLYGRGAYDMKMAVLLLVEEFCKVAPHLDYPLGLQIVTDEEVGGHDGADYQLRQGVAADFYLSGEYTDLEINTSSKGLCWVRLKAYGTLAHGAYPWRGENAIEKMTEVIAKLQKTIPKPSKEAWTTTINFAHVSTPNITFNRIPDEAVLDVDIRYIPDDPRFASPESVRTFFAEIDPTLEVEIVLAEASHAVDSSSKYVQALTDAVIATEGRTPAHTWQHGASDARFYSSAGTDAVTFGLAGSHAHADNEYVTLASVPRFQQALHAFLVNL